MEEVYKTDVLVSESKAGRKKFWQGIVVKAKDTFYTKSKYWQELVSGENSKESESALTEVKTTNEGKANERSGIEQAKFNIESEMNKKIDSGYSSDGSAKVFLPMLAHNYNDRKHNLGNHLAIQPKLDGLRAMQIDGKFWTRKGKPFIADTVKHLIADTEGFIIDGEIILPKEYTFQETMKAVKKFSKNSELLEYHVFDVAHSEDTEFNSESFHNRFQCLKDFVEKCGNSSIVLVDTKFWNRQLKEDESEIFDSHAKLSQNYEGTIIRDASAPYIFNHRSEYLLKLKDFDDAEFPIVNITEGTGKDLGCAVFICKTGDLLFEARPKGSLEERKEYFMNKEKFIGKLAKVKYQGFTDDGIPRFPVALCVRSDYE